MGEYRIVSKLGAVSAVVETFAGVHVRADAQTPVSIKCLAEPWRNASGFLARFSVWARALTAIQHEGVARLLEVGHSQAMPCIVEELVDGESLRSLVGTAATRQVRLPPNELLTVVSLVARTLADLHDAADPVVHGDVCGSTILVTREGRVKLVNTGVARAAGVDAEHGPARSEVQTLAPEHLSGAGGTPGDVFELGLVLFELLSGQPLFSPAGLAELSQCVLRHQAVDVARMPGAPPAMTTLVSRMLAREPDARPTAREVELTLKLVAQQFGWSMTDRDVGILFSRVYPDRPRLEVRANGTSRHFIIEPMAAPLVSEEMALGAGNTPPSGVTLARIATRRISVGELKAAQGVTPTESPVAQPPPEEAAAGAPDQLMGEQLLQKGLITADQLEAASDSVRYYGGTLVEALLSTGVLDEEAVVAVQAEATRSPSIGQARLESMEVPPEVLRLVPRALAEALTVVPLMQKGPSQLMVAMRDPMDGAVLDKLKEATRLGSIVGVRASATALQNAVTRLYGGLQTPPKGAPAVAPVVSPDEPDVVAGKPLPTLTAAAPEPVVDPDYSVGLPEGLFRLVDGLLRLSRAQGDDARAIVHLSLRVAQRMGVTDEKLPAVRYAAVALVASALLEGKRPCQPTLDGAQRLLGAEWTALAPLVRPVLERAPVGASPAALAIKAAFVLAASSSSGLAQSGAARLALDVLKERGGLPPALLQALAAAIV